MKIIALTVDDPIAEGYNSAPPQEKSKINSAISLLLAKFLQKAQNTELFDTIEKLSDEAAKSNLTVEKLGELMDWDKETMKNLFGEEYNINAR